MIGAVILLVCGFAVALSACFAGFFIDGMIGLARLLQKWRERP